MEDGDCDIKPCTLAFECESESDSTFQPTPPSQTSSHSPPPSPKSTTPPCSTLNTEPKPAEGLSNHLMKSNRHTLNSFFVKVTAEEKADLDRCEFEELKSKHEMNLERREKEKREKLLDTREKAKARQQAFRDRKKAEREEAGETSQRGKVSMGNSSNESRLILVTKAKASRF